MALETCGCVVCLCFHATGRKGGICRRCEKGEHEGLPRDERKGGKR